MKIIHLQLGELALTLVGRIIELLSKVMHKVYVLYFAIVLD